MDRYNKAAEGGDADAYNCLGLIYHHGHQHGVADTVQADGSVARDYDTPYQLFMAAANAGCSCAYNNLGLYHELGLVTSKPSSHSQHPTAASAKGAGAREAVYYYSIGAQLGSELSMYNLGYLLIRQHQAAQAARARESSMPLLTNSSNLSISGAAGGGAPEPLDGTDMENGLMWLRRAADCGHSDANFQLGVLYESVGVHVSVCCV